MPLPPSQFAKEMHAKNTQMCARSRARAILYILIMSIPGLGYAIFMFMWWLIKG